MGPVITYKGVALAVETTPGGKRLRVFVARQGPANDVLLFPADAGIEAGDEINVEVEPGVAKDSQNRLLDGVVYWVDGPA